VSVGVINDRQAETLFRGDQNSARHLWREVCGRNKVDVVTAARLQLEHHLSQAFVRNFVLNLLFVRLRDLIVLAIDAAQIAVTEKDVAGAARTYQRRLFAKMRGVRRDNRQATRVTSRDFIPQTIVETVARTDRAAREQSFQRFDTAE